MWLLDGGRTHDDTKERNMNRTIKTVFATLALSASAAFAQDAEIEAEETEGAIGWTPVAIGLATPVQLPWGLNRWDVFGIDVNLFYTDTPKIYGAGVGGFALTTRDTAIGLLASGLANIALEDVYGLRATFGLEYAQKNVYGADLGLVGFREKLYGFDAAFLGSFQRSVCGLQICGIASVSTVESYGVNVAGLANLADTAYGLQVAIGINMTRELHGAQIALVNYTELCPSGFQIGLVNIIMQNRWPVLPIVNGFF